MASLVGALGDRDADVRVAAVRGLVGAKAATALAQAAGSPDPDVRPAALGAIGEVGQAGGGRRSRLRSATAASACVWRRCASLSAAWARTPRGLLVRALGDSSRDVREAAVAGLGVAWAELPTDKLVARLGDETDADVRHAAALALARQADGPHGTAAQQALNHVADNGAPAARLTARVARKISSDLADAWSPSCTSSTNGASTICSQLPWSAVMSADGRARRGLRDAPEALVDHVDRGDRRRQDAGVADHVGVREVHEHEAEALAGDGVDQAVGDGARAHLRLEVVRRRRLFGDGTRRRSSRANGSSRPPLKKNVTCAYFSVSAVRSCAMPSSAGAAAEDLVGATAAENATGSGERLVVLATCRRSAGAAWIRSRRTKPSKSGCVNARVSSRARSERKLEKMIASPFPTSPTGAPPLEWDADRAHELVVHAARRSCCSIARTASVAVRGLLLPSVEQGGNAILHALPALVAVHRVVAADDRSPMVPSSPIVAMLDAASAHDSRRRSWAVYRARRGTRARETRFMPRLLGERRGART